MYYTLSKTIEKLYPFYVSEERKTVIQPLIEYIQNRLKNKQQININFICTHNSRRSILAQVWAQTASTYFNVPNVSCYSGGTEETALFPIIAETLIRQGFRVFKISEGSNPIQAIKYSDNDFPIIGFSKKHNDPFNPISDFAAVMTCSQADDECPFIARAEKRILITFDDPKDSDFTLEQQTVYDQRSLQIATEMFYVFSKINL